MFALRKLGLRLCHTLGDMPGHIACQENPIGSGSVAKRFWLREDRKVPSDTSKVDDARRLLMRCSHVIASRGQQPMTSDD